MLKTIKTAAILGLATLAAAAPSIAHAQSPALQQWYGQFQWEENVGRIGGSAPGEGVVAFVTYTLTLGPAAGASGCMLRAEGYQTDQRMLCTGTPELGSVIIKFYQNGTTPARYYSGQKLFTMRRGENGIVTQLQALRPASDATPASGRLFRRIG